MNKIEMLGRTVQATHCWLNEIAQTLQADKQSAYHALRAVLHTLRDRLLPDESAQFAAQLPTLIRGIYFDGWNPSRGPGKARSREKFLALVNEELQHIRPIDPEDACRAVFSVLNHYVSPDELDEVRQSLPGKIRALWPESRETAHEYSQRFYPHERGFIDPENYGLYGDDERYSSDRNYNYTYSRRPSRSGRYESRRSEGGREMDMNRGYAASGAFEYGSEYDDNRYTDDNRSQQRMTRRRPSSHGYEGYGRPERY